jgi:Transposase DDE domain
MDDCETCCRALVHGYCKNPCISTATCDAAIITSGVAPFREIAVGALSHSRIVCKITSYYPTLTVRSKRGKSRRNDYEYRVLVRLAEALPAEVKVLIVADRGFGDRKLYEVLTEALKFDFVIRFRANIAVTAVDGETRPAADWVGTHPARRRGRRRTPSGRNRVVPCRPTT